jgi:hypothetical protein
MTVLYLIIKAVKELRSAAGPDFKFPGLILLVSDIDSSYVKWSNKASQDWDYFTNSIKSFFVLYFLLLLLLQYFATILFPTVGPLNAILSTEIILVFVLVLFGHTTYERFKVHYTKYSRNVLRLSIKTLAPIFMLILVLEITNTSPSLADQLKEIVFPLFFLLFLLISIILTFIPLLFFGYQMMLMLVRAFIVKSIKQESNQFGHFLRYMGWPPLLLSLLESLIIFF